MNARVLNYHVLAKSRMEEQLRQEYDEKAAEIAREMARKEVVKAQEEFASALDAAILYTLRVGFGFGKVRLLRFYTIFGKLRAEVLEKFHLADGDKDFEWYAARELKQIGVDVEQLRESDDA